MQSSKDFTPDAVKANKLRTVIDSLRDWEEKRISNPKLHIIGDHEGKIYKIFEEKEKK